MSARTGRAIGSRTGARTASVSWAATITWALFTLLVARLSFLFVTAESLAHRFARFLPLLVAQLAIAIFIELLYHSLMHRRARCFTLFVAELAIAVFVVLFEHSLAHFFAAGATAFAAVIRRLRHRRQCCQRHEQSNC
jgi:hypothetical protein